MIINDIKNFLENEPLIKQLKLDCKLPTKQKCNKIILNSIINNCKNIINNKNELIYLIRNKNILEKLHIFCSTCGKKNTFYNGQIGYSRYCCTKCALQDKQTINKIIHTKRNTVKNGLNILQISALKAKQTSLNNIDKNGNNSYQRAANKRAYILLNDIDENGLNGLQRAARKGIETKKNNIDENGLNSIQRGTIKIVKKRRNTINEQGLDSYQIGARKGVITKRTTILNNGKNIFNIAVEKAIQTKRNDIDENGLDGIQRATKKGYNTNLIRIGVENPFASKDPELNGQATKQRKYNNKYYTNRKQAFETCYKNNGKKYYFQTEEYKNYMKQTEVQKRTQQKIYNTKKKNGTFNTSGPEDIIYQALVYKFEFEDINYQYKDKERYNFACDFYIKSLDLFIEINFYWTHGYEPFNYNNIEHLKLLKHWIEESNNINFKNENKDQYNQAIHIWTIDDVNKFKIAKQNKLNYLAFYNWEQFFEWYLYL